MIAQFGVWLAFVSSLLLGAEGVYVYKGDPYKPGRLGVTNYTLTPSIGIPAHTDVFYPTTPGSYVPIVFLPGVFTTIPTELHKTLLTNFAAHGFIIAGVDLFWPIEVKSSFQQVFGIGPSAIGGGLPAPSPKKVFEVMEWLFNNLNKFFSTQGANVNADWSRLGLMSHSVSADYLVEILQQNSTIGKAVAFLEPGSNLFTKPLDYSIPAISYGTQFCMEDPKCCKAGWSYFHFYAELTCPKLLMNVTGYGHCDLMDNVGWDMCRLVHFCKVDPSNNRDLYREVFLPGVLSAFFGTYLQENEALLKYITTQDLMPIPLGQLEYDLNCSVNKTPGRV